MDIARLSRDLRLSANLHVSGTPLNRFAIRCLDRVITFVGGEQPRPRTNLDLLQSARGGCRLLDIFGWIVVSGGIHDVHPNRQRQLASKCAAINLLRFIETCPNGAGEIGIVPGKQRIGKIVCSAGFTCCRNFLQTKLREGSFACP